MPTVTGFASRRYWRVLGGGIVRCWEGIESRLLSGWKHILHPDLDHISLSVDVVDLD